jgi:hypothetical protein
MVQVGGEVVRSSRQLALARPLSSAKLGPLHHTKASMRQFHYFDPQQRTARPILILICAQLD